MDYDARVANDLRKLLREFKRWGVEFQNAACPLRTDGAYRDHETVAGRYLFWGGVTDTSVVEIPYLNEKLKPTVWFPDPIEKGKDIHHILHELSHVVIGEDPGISLDEFESGMVAFEYHTSRRLRLNGWSSWMDSYIGWEEARFRMDESRRAAVEAQLLTEKMVPTYDLWALRQFQQALKEDHVPDDE